MGIFLHREHVPAASVMNAIVEVQVSGCKVCPSYIYRPGLRQARPPTRRKTRGAVTGNEPLTQIKGYIAAVVLNIQIAGNQ